MHVGIHSANFQEKKKLVTNQISEYEIDFGGNFFPSHMACKPPELNSLQYDRNCQISSNNLKLFIDQIILPTSFSQTCVHSHMFLCTHMYKGGQICKLSDSLLFRKQIPYFWTLFYKSGHSVHNGR